MNIEQESAVREASGGSPWRSLIQQNRFDDAAAALERHLAESPRDAAALHDLGVVRGRQKRFDEAAAKLRAATEVDPLRGDSFRTLARAYADLGRLADSEACLVKVTDLRPNSAEAFRALAELRKRAGRLEVAIDAFQRAAELEPKSPQRQHDLARALSEAKRHNEAKKAYLQTVELDPGFAEAFNNLGVLCQEMGALDEAVNFLRESIRLRPGVVGAYNNLGVALNEQRKYEEAVDAYNKALAIAPGYAIAWNNLGNALRATGKNRAAVLALERAIQLKPDYPEAYNNLAIAHVQLADHERAMEGYDKALCFRPDYPECHMNRGLQRLLSGDLANGWADYEWRWHLKALRSRKFAQPRWDGSPLGGKQILLHYEQGLGDTLHFIRYAVELKRRGATVVFEGQPVLRHILARTPGIDAFVDRGRELPPFDVHSPLLSLPAVCQTTLQNIPAEVPYVFADPHFVKLWEPRLASLEGLRIGIAWQGNPEHRGDRSRSIPLRCFEVLARIDGVRLVSLQRNFGSEQVAQLDRSFEVTTFTGVDEHVDGFLRTAAIMRNLELVISADTAVAHLAGAMGLPTWVAIAMACDWRWLRDREDTPWYPTLRLFRQREIGNWGEVFDRIASALKEWTATRGASRNVGTAPAVSKAKVTQHLREAARLVEQNELDRAERLLHEAAAADPNRAETHHDLGVVLARRGMIDQAISYFRRAIELKPDYCGAYGNLGLAFLQRDRIEEAIASLQKAIKLGGGTPEVYNHLGVAQMRVPDPAAAETNYVNALHLRPEFAAAHCNLARALLAQGKYEQSWLEHEWRGVAAPQRRRKFDRPRWMGLPLRGQTILLYAEEGATLGDTLQFVRYASTLKAMGGRVIVESQPALARVLTRCEGVDQVIARGGDLGLFDVHAALMSVPAIIGTTLKTVPKAIPYISADPELVERWRSPIRSLHGFRVAIAWPDRCNADGPAGAALLQVLSQVSGARLIDLHQSLESGSREAIVELGFGRDLSAADTWDNVSAVMIHFDLVIAADITTAHLAGAMGVPVWLVLPAAPDPRWMLERTDSPWYPTLRIFRQPRGDGWRAVFQELGAELHARVAAALPLGELTEHVERAGVTFHAAGRRRFARGDWEGASEQLQKAVRSSPDRGAAHHDLGVTLAKLKQMDGAVQHLRRAWELDRTRSSCGNLALALLETRDYSGAIAFLKEAVTSYPGAPELHLRMGAALSAVNRRREAAESFARAVQLQPESAEAQHALANQQRLTGDCPSAIQSYHRTLELRPTWPEAYNHLGLALAAAGNHEAAIHAYRQAIHFKRDYPEAYQNLGRVFSDVGRLDEAAEALQDALYVQPDNPRIHCELAIVLLEQGNYDRGWLEYEWRLRASNARRRKLPGRRWDGAPLAGKSLLLVAEQSLDDTLQFTRYARLAKEQGARVSLVCQPPLVDLLSQCTYLDRVIPEGSPPPQCDFHSMLMSAPVGFGTTSTSVPTLVPYLTADPKRFEVWRQALGPGGGRRVGVHWDAGGYGAHDGRQSIPLTQFRTLAQLEGVELVSLQPEPSRSPNVLAPVHLHYPRLGEGETTTLADVAAILRHLDAVVACDSAVVHLAGAMGIPTYLALSSACHWRWMVDRTDTPWYPTVKLFRQHVPGCWNGMLEEIADSLSAQFGRATT